MSQGIVLIGYRGTGKSSVGRILASRLGISFVDADAALEARFGRSVRSIFEEQGEPTFRDYEEEVLKILTANRTGLIATGGGAILRESNRRALREFGRVFWLTAEPDVLASRLAIDSQGVAERPSLTKAGTLAEIATVLEARRALYEETADHVVDTGGLSTSEVSEAILEILAPEGVGRRIRCND